MKVAWFFNCYGEFIEPYEDIDPERVRDIDIPEDIWQAYEAHKALFLEYQSIVWSYYEDEGGK